MCSSDLVCVCVWYGVWYVVWCGMWCGMVCGVVWCVVCGVVWYVVWHGVWYGVWYGMVCGMVCGVVCGVVWYVVWYGDLVEELRKKSNGKTSLAEAQRRVFAESKLYLFYIAELIRAGMRKVVQTEAYQRIERAPWNVVTVIMWENFILI